MADEFDEELQQEPDSSILTPIFLGCSAMGLGCVFSLGVIAIGLFFFVPGIWDAVSSFGGDSMFEQALPMIEANEEVVAALGTPIEATLDDVDEVPGAELSDIEVGDQIEILMTYDLEGPQGTGRLDAVGSRALVANDEWEIQSLTVTLEDGRVIEVLRAEDVAPPPTPPALPEETSDGDTSTDAASEESSSEEPSDETGTGEAPLLEEGTEGSDVSEEPASAEPDQN